MSQPSGGRTGKIGVVGAEQLAGFGVILGLDQPTLVTDLDFQRIIFFRTGQILLGEVRIGGGCETQIQKSMRQFRRATSAFHSREIPLKSWSISGCSRSRDDISDIARGQAIASLASDGRNPPSATGS